MMITNPQNSTLKPGPTPIKPGLNQPITNPSLNPNHYSPSSLSKSPSHLQKPHLPSPPLMALSLSRPRHRSLTNPSLIHLFSSSSTSPSDDDSSDSQSQQQQQQEQQQQPSVSDYFRDVKASLKPQNPQNQPNLPPLRRPTYPLNTANQSVSIPTSNFASFDEIRKNLSEFRRRSSVPSPTDPNSAPSSQQPSSSQRISFQDLYKKNVLEKSEGGSGTTQSSRPNSPNQPIAGRYSFDEIRESLRQMRGGNNNSADGRGGGEGMPFSNFKLRPGNENESRNKSTIVGGTEGLPSAVFGKEKEEGSAKADISTEFVKMYSYAELGDKLKILRPEVKKGEKGWFTLEELNERLRKLREMEEKETESRIGGFSFKDLRESLLKLKISDDDKKKNSIQRLNLLGQLGTQNFTLEPPKKHLVEKYFHPDNMSSPEKMKIELAKVRDEFKMSESDCGSARVQVALLTTKIKHLSSVLHKKDKHSRKGLMAMVQKRKKLLKYLRRTDWDSYCLVLSKFGLRDNPDHKSWTRV